MILLFLHCQGNGAIGTLDLQVEISDGQDHGLGVANPRVSVQVTLVDINDQSPVFTNLANFIVKQEVSKLYHFSFSRCLFGVFECP